MQKTFNAKKAWLMAVITILFAISFPATFLKVPPVMPYLIEHFQINLTLVGLLMTVPSLAIFIAALPGGMICARFGAKATLFTALGFAIIGNILGAISGMVVSFPLMLVARFFDGASFSIAGIGAMAVISLWFPQQKRGLPMAIFAVWVAFGQLMVFNAAVPIIDVFGSWQGVWWSLIVFSVIIAALFAVIVKKPQPGEGSDVEDEPEQEGQKASIFEGFKLRFAWMIAAMDFLFTTMYSVFNNYYVTYMNDVLGMDMGAANNLYSITIAANIIGCLAAGFILIKLNKDKHPLFLAIILVPLVIGATVQYLITSTVVMLPFLLIFGLINQLPKAIYFTIAPNLSPNQKSVGPVMSIITLGQAAGGIIGPMLVGPLVEVEGGNIWTNLVPLQAGVMIVMFILSLLLIREAKKIRLRQAESKTEAIEASGTAE